ncbi:class I SAM-dependent methyltransferase [Specibacter cremeus]|uniref:class I SAM-dependent methyltransferase n=1 Tax=Specibacter cremeus TaxID=1629051 RepID=UPI000F7B8E33|nr:class I SAM-dependent methyltransferase [Specibacter cremeus]
MLPVGGPSLDDDKRRELGAAFLSGGEHYDAVRPGYPADSVTWLTEGLVRRGAALDVGAGTGKFTARLLEQGWDVTALDPSADMLAQLHANHPDVQVIVGATESIELPDGCMDLATVAQAWHWCDPLRASTELARVLRPGGTLGLVWNQLDVTVPWVHRLARIMHAGDVHNPGFRPAVGPEFTGLVNHETHWAQPVTPEDLLELVKSRSYYLHAPDAIRAKVLGNLGWYLFEHLGHAPGESLDLPYFTSTWRARSVR